MAAATHSPRSSSRPRARRLVTAAVACVAVLTGLVAPAAAQEAPATDAPLATEATGATPEVTTAAAGDLAVEGHGWGHGRGMGQFGSLGYATGVAGAAWSHAQILQHFYGGTSVGHIGNPLMMVWLKGRPAGSAMVVYRAAGLQVRGQEDTPPAVRVTPRADGRFDLQTGTGCGGPWSTNERIVDGPVRVVPMPDSGTTALRLCYSDGSAIAYHPSSELVALADKTYNLVRMEEMLRGIVPRESPASWGNTENGMASLRAQAVAARSYAAAGDTRWGSPHQAVGADATTCDDQFCQVYGGIARITPGGAVETRTHANTDRAIAETANEVRTTSAGGVARTEFSSSTGGYTAGGAFPAVPDQGDAVSSNPNHRWTTAVSRASVEAKYGLGTLTEIQVLERNGLGDMGGRVTRLRLVGTNATKEVTGNEFRSAFGLKSDWFNATIPQPPPPPPVEPRSIDTACPASQPSGTFADVAADNPHRRAIDCVAAHDIAEGIGPGQFSPSRTVTRAQMASFVARMIDAAGGTLPGAPANAFDDDTGSVHEHAINQLAAVDVVNGVSARTYAPNDPIDRAQLASILARALEHLDVVLPPSPEGHFTDDNGSVHETAIDQLAAEGVVTGTSSGTYQPGASARRDQMASMLARALDLALDE